MAMEILAERKDRTNGEFLRVFEVGGITIRWRHWQLYGGGDWFLCRGTRQELLEAGVCDECWFPVAPKRLNRFEALEPGQRLTVRKEKGDLYEVQLEDRNTGLRPLTERCQRLISGAKPAIQRGHLRLVWSAPV